ncbi:hypothetical protein EOL70_16070 [Leucothrix sargassi]|nr:hypothetical protein EOL70_16070 [Leucothrix sargassi]
MNQTYAHTLHHLPADTTEAWLFETSKARAKVEAEWAKQGKKLTLHSAYKSLLHEILEDKAFKAAAKILIRFPVIEGDDPQRFRLECYPINDLVDATVQFEAFDGVVGETELPYYEVITESATKRFPIPVRWVTSKSNKRQLVACGWRINEQGEGSYLPTEFEAIFNDACQYFADLPLQPLTASEENGPFFNRLVLRVGLPMRDTPLHVNQESISFIEAMHEDIYFSALEIIHHRLNRESNDRSLKVGHIIPEVYYAHKPKLKVRLNAPETVEGEENESHLAVCLDTLGHWPTPQLISYQLDKLDGARFSTTSRQGRTVQGCALVNDSKVKLAISGGQHANESSGIVGGLRAAHALKAQGNMDFTICPSENVDGYALFRQLCEHNPNHMHHAARYTSTGTDLTFSTTFESRIREEAKAQLAADVHVNLHGYPAHEWTRPLSGYVPEGFTTWTIPKGFFVICRYNSGYEAKARVILEAAINAVLGHEAQKQQNADMLKRFFDIVSGSSFELAEGVVPYMISEHNDTDYPIEIITEAPDETVYGNDFRIAHESHYRVIMAIAKVMQAELINEG